MSAKGKRNLILLWLCCLTGQTLFAEAYRSINNHTGTWEKPATWDPVWPAPQYDVSEHIVTICGFITARNSLSFSDASKLTIKDTLVVQGNLTIHDNNQLRIESDGILIVWGDLIFSDSSQISVQGYLIVTGDIIVADTIQHGRFRSFSDPSQVFICGSVPVELTDNNPLVPALNCTSPVSTTYPNTSCSYGNLADLQNEPIYSFFVSACFAEVATIAASGPIDFCEGDSVTLYAGLASTYLWSTGDTTASITVHASGSYHVQITDAFQCQSDISESVDVEVIALPTVTIINDSSICLYDAIALTGNPAGGTFTLINGPASLSENVLTANGIGEIQIMYTYANQCSNDVSQTLSVEEIPNVLAGPDQELDFQFNTQMNAALSAHETGEWSLISGSAVLEDEYSPVTPVSDLSPGENSFLWTVSNGNCSAEARVDIMVNDLFIPSVITPNGDSKNEFFVLGETEYRTRLIIFNRWGIVEYSSSDYSNDWNGINDRDEALPEDTYFYVLSFGNGIVRKGSVLIVR